MDTIKCAHCGARNYVQVDVKWMSRVRRMEREHAALLVACKGAYAALTQPATYPADIEAARSFLRAAQPTAGEREGANK
jgi:hypothetical protein